MTLTPVLSAHWDELDSYKISGYQRHGGYTAVKKAFATGPDEIISIVKDSGLRGRGGAGFPTGLKWSFVPQGDNKPHYLVVNADESEPGACKDTPLMMANPHSLIEGIIIAAYAMRANHAFIYILVRALILKSCYTQAQAPIFVAKKLRYWIPLRGAEVSLD
jgi:NADH-quinone oxidoreductase subunit F